MPMRYRLFDKASDEGGGGGDGEGGEADKAAIEQKAVEMGWSPKDKWRGHADQWIDAAEFVKRGEQVMPILQANLRKEQQARQALETKLQQQTNLLNAAQESITVLVNMNTKESRERAKEKRRELLRAQAAARKDENHELEIQLGEQISDVSAAIANSEEEGDEGEAPTPTAKRKSGKATRVPADDPVNHPDFIAWRQDNPWFGVDEYRTSAATVAGQKLRRAGDTTQGRAFFDKVTEEVNKVFAPHRAAAGSKVESSSGGAGGGGAAGANGKGKAYNDLPPDAKAACDRQASWVVGEGRAFKDIAAWKKHYCEIYFSE